MDRFAVALIFIGVFLTFGGCFEPDDGAATTEVTGEENPKPLCIKEDLVQTLTQQMNGFAWSLRPQFLALRRLGFMRMSPITNRLKPVRDYPTCPTQLF